MGPKTARWADNVIYERPDWIEGPLAGSHHELAEGRPRHLRVTGPTGSRVAGGISGHCRDEAADSGGGRHSGAGSFDNGPPVGSLIKRRDIGEPAATPTDADTAEPEEADELGEPGGGQSNLSEGQPGEGADLLAPSATRETVGGAELDEFRGAMANGSSQCETLEEILEARPSPLIGLIFGLIYSFIFVFGLVGNILTLYVLLCKGDKRTVQDILIANLACSDLMLCFFAVPITPKYLIRDGHWTLGPALCKVVSFAQSISVYMSTYSLICIGYTRYRMIVHPLEESLSKRTAALTCLGTWLVGIIVTLPYMLQVRLSPENCDIKFCDEAWEKSYHRFIFSIFTICFQFLIPLASVCFFYNRIYAQLDGRRMIEHGASAGGLQQQQVHFLPSGSDNNQTTFSSAMVVVGSNNNHSAGSRAGPPPPALEAQGVQLVLEGGGAASTGAAGKRQSRQRAVDVIAVKEHRRRGKEKRMRKANMRLIFVVCIFANSWLPLNLFNIAQDYFETMSHWPYLTNTFLIVHQIACSSVCWNPILYAWMSETYRQELRNALPEFIVIRFRSVLEPTGRRRRRTPGENRREVEPRSSNHINHLALRFNDSIHLIASHQPLEPLQQQQQPAVTTTTSATKATTLINNNQSTATTVT